LEAQLHAVAHIHYHLPMYPVAWICQKADPNFLLLYLKARTKYNTLKVVAVAVVFSRFFPFLYANVVMTDPCKPAQYEARPASIESGPYLTLTPLGLECDVVGFVRSPRIILWGPWVLLSVFLLTWIFMQLGNRFRRTQFKLLMLAKPFMWRIFFNGLGLRGTQHGAWEMFCHTIPGADLRNQYSVYHDFLGTVDICMFCLALVCVVVVSCLMVGAMLHGLRGALFGGSIGLVVSRVLFALLNALLGASDSLIATVEAKLKNHQPHRRILRNSAQEVCERAIEREVSEAARWVEQSSGVSAEDLPAAKELAARIRLSGAQVLKGIAVWLKRHEVEMAHTQQACYNLYLANGAMFAGTEYTIASLSFLDLQIFLMAYFDPDWQTIAKFQTERRCHRHLRTIHIGAPKILLCTKREEGPRWDIQTSSDLIHELSESWGYRALSPGL